MPKPSKVPGVSENVIWGLYAKTALSRDLSLRAPNKSYVILNPSFVILSEAKDLKVNSAKNLQEEILRLRLRMTVLLDVLR